VSPMKRLVLLATLLAWSGHEDPCTASEPAPEPSPTTAVREMEPIKPIPKTLPLDARKVALGEALFRDPRLSQDNSISCASCHDMRLGGADGRVHSVGIKGREGDINAPTVLNSGFNFRQFWNGRAISLEDQVDGPVHNEKEMGSTWEAVVARLRDVADYRDRFKRIYPGEIMAGNIKDAIAEYERSLITPNSRFDRFLNGEQDALNRDEKEGYAKFKAYGCTSCHQGVNVGGNMFEPLGAMADYFKDRGSVTKADYGRFNVTGREPDRFSFKVPGLRNVARTAPYFHDGSASTLEEAVVIMGKYQLGQQLSPEDVRQIVLFLKTLTGEYRGRPL